MPTVFPAGCITTTVCPQVCSSALRATATRPWWAGPRTGFLIYAPRGYRDPNDPGKGVRILRPSYRIRSGIRPGGPGGPYDGQYGADWEYVAGLGDLDATNGRETVTPEYPEGIYAYFLTADFPFLPRGFVGTPDPSFQVHLKPGVRPRDRRPPPDGVPRRPWSGPRA
ncbi:MAG: YHYH protein [Gammaproteobacteria bacterium]